MNAITTIIDGGEILTPEGLRSGTITIADGVIRTITEAQPGTEGTAADVDTDTHVIDGTGLIVSPGFIDLQINGGFGIDLASTPDAMWQLGRELPRHGVTGFLPTIISGPAAARTAALGAVRQRPIDYLGAEPLGIHFEGPMLNQQRAGAHSVRHLVPPSLEMIEEWTLANGVALVTIAPELENADRIITELVRRGVTVSAGHTCATADDARTAMAAGITMVTHLFNAMTPLDHRNPNLVGVTLARNSLVAGLIVDGVHVDPTVVAATWNAKGPAGLVLVTDAVAPMGQGPGRYEFSRSVIIADDRCVRNEAGTLAGSILTMDQAVRNLIDYTKCEAEDALLAATATPASVIGQSDRGQLRPGTAADLTLLDQDLQVQLTLCAGELAYAADASRFRSTQDAQKPG